MRGGAPPFELNDDGAYRRETRAEWIPQGGEKGPAARRHSKVAGEAYPWYVEPATERANEADGPLSAACYPRITLSSFFA